MNQDAEKTPRAICGSKECNKEKIVPMTKESRKRAFNLLSKILSELHEPNSLFVTIFTSIN
ncbi:hypothetical protein [Lentilactobacillus kefiri]|uniref:hypothetical protein n=1 Tax=Lentilactobacillus kefiri TaxID=33962 RepID=UPI0020731E57|nr:hypothetical protein [Lentilactobacillus kefiri]